MRWKFFRCLIERPSSLRAYLRGIVWLIYFLEQNTECIRLEPIQNGTKETFKSVFERTFFEKPNN